MSSSSNIFHRMAELIHNWYTILNLCSIVKGNVKILPLFKFLRFMFYKHKSLWVDCMLNKEVIKNSLLLTFKEITIMKLQQRNYKITKKLANSEQSDDFYLHCRSFFTHTRICLYRKHSVKTIFGWISNWSFKLLQESLKTKWRKAKNLNILTLKIQQVL